MAKRKYVRKQKPESVSDKKVKIKPDEAFTGILALIREYEPEEQNAIVSQLIKEIAIDRHTLYKSSVVNRDRRGKLLDEFLRSSNAVENILKELDAKSSN